MYLPITLFIIFMISLVFIIVANKLHFSEAIGLIVVGLLMSLPFFKDSVIAGHEVVIEDMANIGLFTLMFISGFEISGNMLIRERKDSLILTLFTITSSLILGFVVFRLLGFSTMTALMMGVCFGVTAEATKARILLKLKEIKSRIGTLLLGTGIINDVFGIIFLIIVAYFFTGSLSFKEIWILGGIIISFVLGMLVHVFFDRESKEIRVLEKVLLITLVPFFFINMGLHFSLSRTVFDYRLFFIVLLTSFLGQMIGTILSKKFINISLRQSVLVGFSMNSKGAVELAIAFVALQVGIITSSLYMALVFTALVSTVIFQAIAFRIVARHPGIME